MVWASADSAAALETRLALYAARAFRYSFLAASVFRLYTCFCSSPRLSHIDATIFETSPKVALGF
jgi:nitroreductase